MISLPACQHDGQAVEKSLRQMETEGSVAAEDRLVATPQLKLLVGLGNPGVEYAGTRHNLGFLAVEHFMEASGNRGLCEWQPENGQLYRVNLAARQVLVLKPMTYMNESGRAVGETSSRFGISPQELLVVSDDLDMPLGRLRQRTKGSCGGHRGLASIAQVLGCEDFPRLRLGIGRPQSGLTTIVDYVLGCWTSEEAQVLADVLEAAVILIRKGIESGVEGCSQRVPERTSDQDNAEVQGAEH